jgi:division protein CdvB (Snf7/Vps24/ESCRT-III family)
MATTEELLQLILSRLDKMDSRFDTVEERLQTIETDNEQHLAITKKLSEGVDYLTVKVESELMNKVGALFDAREVSLDSDKRLEQKMDILASTVDNLRIEMLKGFEDIKEDRRSITELLGEHSVEIKTLARKVPQ